MEPTRYRAMKTRASIIGFHPIPCGGEPLASNCENQDGKRHQSKVDEGHAAAPARGRDLGCGAGPKTSGRNSYRLIPDISSITRTCLAGTAVHSWTDCRVVPIRCATAALPPAISTACFVMAKNLLMKGRINPRWRGRQLKPDTCQKKPSLCVDNLQSRHNDYEQCVNHHHTITREPRHQPGRACAPGWHITANR